MLGAPQAQEDAFDELDYGRDEAWRKESDSEYNLNHQEKYKQIFTLQVQCDQQIVDCTRTETFAKEFK